MGLIGRIEKYWTDRADGYSKVNQEELGGGQKVRWLGVLKSYFPDMEPKELRVLDIGTGPGFFAILLAEAGYLVTAVDYTEEMLTEAKKNAGEYAGKIQWLRMDAQNLGFADGEFDVVVSRNLTWNLECPEDAYRHWHRVLKPGGRMLNFDANWYHHLFDDQLRFAYEKDRCNVEQEGVEDHYIGTDIDEMEAIARQVPLSRKMRPGWDRHVMKKLGFREIEAVREIWERVWSDTEKVNYGSTPMFLIWGVK